MGCAVREDHHVQRWKRAVDPEPPLALRAITEPKIQVFARPERDRVEEAIGARELSIRLPRVLHAGNGLAREHHGDEPCRTQNRDRDHDLQEDDSPPS